jgi:hypothetical protein
VVEKGEITWENDEDFEVEQIVDYVEDDVIMNFVTNIYKYTIYVMHCLYIGQHTEILYERHMQSNER